MSTCQIRQCYSEECEAGINKQINLELYASYVYLSMAYHFDRDDVALKGFHKFFKKNSDEERQHAQMFMKYQNQRGGRLVYQDIKKPLVNCWSCGLEAMENALELEKNVYQALMDLHKLAGTHNDVQMQDFIESNFLNEQIEAIKELGDHITNLKRTGPGQGSLVLKYASFGHNPMEIIFIDYLKQLRHASR